MEPDLLGQVVQFGTAGLMAWMWLSERRGAATRERELTEAHTRLMEQRVQVEALLSAVRDNARAAGSLEAGQRAIATAVDRIAEGVAALSRVGVAWRPGQARAGWSAGGQAPRAGAEERAPDTLSA